MSEPTTATTDDRPLPLVHAVNVTKAFQGTEVLKGIDMDVRRGEVVVLLGPSGSGKTTFLRCINQLETIDGGRIWVDGDLMGYEDRGGTLHRLPDKRDRRPAPRHRHVLPAVQPLPAQDGARERHRGADAGQGRQEEGRRRRRPSSCSSRWAWATSRPPTPRSSPVASSSASPSPGPSPWTPS